MNTFDIARPLTAHALNENLFKQFNVRINFDKYTREDLENYRNLLRTKINQVESGANFNELLTNEDYQKDKYVLGVINTKIKEMLGEAKLSEKKLTGAETKKKEKIVKSMKKDKGDFEKRYGKRGKEVMYATATKLAKKKAEESVEEGTKMKKKSNAKPDFLDMDKDGNKKEPMKKAVADKKKKEPANEMFYYDDKGKSKQKPQDVLGRRKPGEIAKYPNDFKSMKKDKKMSKQYPVGGPKGKLPESTKNKVKESRLLEDSKTIIEAVVYYLREDEEGKAKAITSGVDMVNDFTSWMQRVANYQTKTMIELADSIRANFGVQEAETFKSSVGVALENALNSLTTAREEINNAVAVLAGEAPAAEPMGQEPGMGDMDMDMAEPDEMNLPGEDEFAASDAAAGGPETLGRMKRESIERGNRLMKILGA